MVFPTDCPGGHRVSISPFTLSDSFFAEPRASVLVFMFCASGLIFGGTESVGSRFYVLRSRTRFRRFRGRRDPFSCIARPNSFLVVLKTSGPVYMFCTPRLIFGATKGVSSRFHVLRFRTRFRRYRGRGVPFSFFAQPDLFSTVPRASDPVFMFSARENFFCGAESVGSRFHIFRSRTRFRRYLLVLCPRSQSNIDGFIFYSCIG
jgi:hypothetical protein